MLVDLIDVLHRPRLARFVDPDLRTALLSQLLELGVRFMPTVQVTDCRDPKDDKYLELALTADAATIVSSDQDLLILHPWRGVRIVRRRITWRKPPMAHDLILPDLRTAALAGGIAVPALVMVAGEAAARRFLEFFAGTIRNAHTRRAYGRAAGAFLAWCEETGITSITAVQPLMWPPGSSCRQGSAPPQA